MSFGDFARAVAEIPDHEAEPHFRSQHEFIADPAGRTIVDFVGRFEHLAEDFERVRERIKRPIALPHLLKSTRGGYRRNYDSRLRDLIGARNAHDIALFRYDFSSPRRRAYAG